MGLRLNKGATPATPAASKGELFYSNVLSPNSPAWVNEGGLVYRVGGVWVAAATAGQSGFASDAYLAGSGIGIGQAGGWAAGMIYNCVFDMTKTAAGTATPILTVRMGTTGTVADASIGTITFGAGTAAADTGVFEVQLAFRSVGGGTSAVVAGWASCAHHLAATGLTSTGASGTGIVTFSSAGFNSTTQTFLGLSLNGGASFAGTNVAVRSFLEG